MHESFSKPTALIIVDVQNDFISGSLAVPDGERVAHGIVDYLKGGSGGWEHDYIVTTQDWHDDPGDHFSETPDYIDTWPVHCKAGTWGGMLHDAILSIQADAHFLKGLYSAAYSGFEGTGPFGVTLYQWLGVKGVDMVDICGIATDYCVKATALDAVKSGFHTTLLTDLIAAVSPDTGEAAIREMASKGVTIA